MNKTQMVIAKIVENGIGMEIDRQHLMNEIGCSAATVTKAVNILNAEEAIENNVYVGRQFVREIADYIQDDVILTDNWYSEMAAKLHTARTALWLSIDYRIRGGLLTQKATAYGLMIRRSI
jgi:DNA-binding GntR family transcriptional regulator